MVTIKSKREIELMREACRVAAIAQKAVEKAIRPGTTTWELDKIAEKIIRENDNLDKNKLVKLLSKFSTLNIQYYQLCDDLIVFLKIFKPENKEIRLYKTDELVELLNQKALEFEN